MRKAVFVLAVVLALLSMPVPSFAAALPAMSLRHVPASTAQVIIVHGPSAAATSATLDTFERTRTGWQRAWPTMAARIGRLGFSDHHVEGTPNTPTGMYPLGPTLYGIDADPGFKYPYRRLVDGDWWNGNSASKGYNTFYHGRNPGGASEALWRTYPAYRYFAVIGYNSPATPGRGSAIFLHEGTGGPTAGCVSLGHADLVRVLRWIDPRYSPRIVVSPDQGLSRY
jgi:L,D-peptidoglycan transpeptidase YkuD (ErfK/YbiS/YcfS/YnhG family)